MTEQERLALEEVRSEMDAARRAFQEALERRPMDYDLGLAAGRLETTYLLRVYATFEGLLRGRLGPAIGDAEGLTNLVQRIANAGLTYDPATKINVEWRELFRRDRNPLMHGRQSPPSWSINTKIQQMQNFLNLFPHRAAP